MKIAILSEANPLKVYEIQRLKEEGTSLEITVDHYRFSEISMVFNSSNLVLLVNDVNLIEEYDAFILRSAKKDLISFEHYKGMISYLAKKNKKFVLNHSLNSEFYNWSSKIFNYTIMASNSIPVVPSFNFAQLNGNINQLTTMNLNFPLITKKSKSSHGNGIQIHYTMEDLKLFFSFNTPEQFLIQPFIDSNPSEKEDIRIITIGNIVIGGYKKVAKKGSIVTNLGAGGHTAQLNLTEDLVDLSKKVSEVFRSDYLGIDIIINDGKPQVLEINKAAQFEGFESATNINLAKKLIVYCKKSFEKISS